MIRGEVSFFTRLLCWFCLLLVSWHGQRCVTHFECEDGDCGRASQLERRGGVGQKGAVIVFDVVWIVVDDFLLGQACVTLVQHASDTVVDKSSKIHGTIVWAWPGAVRVVLEHRGCVFHHCSSLAAREARFGHDCGKGPPHADHDAQRSSVGVRRNRTHVRRWVGEVVD